MPNTVRPTSMLYRRPSQQALLPRPLSTSAAPGWGSSSTVDTIHLENSMETLVSAPLKSNQESRQSHEQNQLDFSRSRNSVGGEVYGRPYSAAVGWNSSTTLRASSSAGSLKAKVEQSHSSAGDMAEGGGPYKQPDTRAIRIRYALMVSIVSSWPLWL
jgi:hypothetical protein